MYLIRTAYKATECSLEKPRRLTTKKSVPAKIEIITFSDSEGVIHKEFALEGSTVNKQYCLGVMQRLLARITDRYNTGPVNSNGGI